MTVFSTKHQYFNKFTASNWAFSIVGKNDIVTNFDFQTLANIETESPLTG